MPDLGIKELTGDVEQYQDFFAALEKTSPFAMGFEALSGSIKGRCNYEEKCILINEGMDELQNIKTAIHEIAHATLHDIDKDAPERPDRRTREVQAESVAYAVCQHYGLDTSDYSFGYIAGWSSGKELAELKGSLETIRSTAASLIDTIDGHFAEIQKAQDKEQTTEQAQTPQEATIQPEAEAAAPELPEETAPVQEKKHRPSRKLIQAQAAKHHSRNKLHPPHLITQSTKLPPNVQRTQTVFPIISKAARRLNTGTM